ncbi:hypothetical protein MKW98_024720 [Papaver atlanticum]|uniref:FAD-binding domain-containing protein n=1 Tax=Papaver atlanticum TaxID=357466 RepID=A0AAD4S230_9MAGN|nr:hypothetical protein MKW98_024720 [Papaver atlanticum]
MIEEDIVIVGAGIAGLATSLGLHRMGLKSLVLESWENLRVTGFAFTTFTNAWKALDALGIGDTLREQHILLQGLVATSTISGIPTSHVVYRPSRKFVRHEIRCVGRKVLLETLANELPQGTIRFCSKVVSIEEQGHAKLIHLADGSVIKTKVLIGCDGVNLVVAKWLGLQEPVFAGRTSIRGHAVFKENEGHCFGPTFLQIFGDGCRSGFQPVNQNTIYWFFTHAQSILPRDLIDQNDIFGTEIFFSWIETEEADSINTKQYMVMKLGKAPKEVIDIIEKTDPKSIVISPLRFRWPSSILFGSISKANVCVAGDALHPMTPDIGQGANAALEDGVVLARCLSQALLLKATDETAEYNNINTGLAKYAKERRWRSFELASTSYIVGVLQQGSMFIKFIRDKFLSPYLAGMLLKRAEFDCGKLDT